MLHFVQYADAGGFIPSSVINMKIPRQLMQVKNIIDEFSRDDEVDKSALEAYAALIRDKRQKYTSYELDFIQRGRDFHRMCTNQSAYFKILKSPDPGVKIKAVHIDGDSLMTGLAVAVIDTDVAKCLAYEFMKDSRGSMARRKQKHIALAAVHKLNEHSHNYLSVRDGLGRGLFSREFRVKGVWKVFDNGAAILVYEDTNDLDDDYPSKMGAVTASIRMACMFEPLHEICGIPQTRVSLVGRIDLKGTIPTIFSNPSIGKYFTNLSEMRQKFDRSQEIDRARRLIIINEISSVKSYYPDFDQRFDGITEKDSKGGSIVLLKKKLSCGEAKIRLTVRAGLEEAAAYLFDYESRSNRAFEDASREILGNNGDLELCVKRKTVLQGSFQQVCIFFCTLKLCVVDSDTIVILISPENEKSNGPENENEGSEETSGFRRKRSAYFSFRSSMHKVVAKENSAIKLTRLGPGETRIDVVSQLEYGMAMGKEVIKNELNRLLCGYRAMSDACLNLLRVENLSERDGTTFGILLHDRGVQAIHTFDALSSFQADFPWFKAMIEEVLRNKLRSSNVPIKAKAECLTDREAINIGGALAASLAVNVTAAGGVDE